VPQASVHAYGVLCMLFAFAMAGFAGAPATWYIFSLALDKNLYMFKWHHVCLVMVVFLCTEVRAGERGGTFVQKRASQGR